MIKNKIKSGDMFLVDSTRTPAKIVKFLQTAPTILAHLWRKITGTQEKVLYYHAGCFYNPDEIIEQQWKVIRRTSEKILNSRNRVFIARRKDSDRTAQDYFQEISMKDLGEGYDIVNIFGKLLTWLTGIPLFEAFMQIPNQEICINRVAYWYKKVYREKFGQLTHSAVTTHEMYKWIKTHPEQWEVIFEGYPREEI